MNLSGTISVLDEKRNYNKRLISVVIFIKKQKNELNLPNDTELLSPLYPTIIEFLSTMCDSGVDAISTTLSQHRKNNRN